MDLLHNIGEFDVRGGRPGLQAVLRPHQDVDAASLQLGAGAAVQEQRLTFVQPVQDGRSGHGSSRAHGRSQNIIAVSGAYSGMRTVFLSANTERREKANVTVLLSLFPLFSWPQ